MQPSSAAHDAALARNADLLRAAERERAAQSVRPHRRPWLRVPRRRRAEAPVSPSPATQES